MTNHEVRFLPALFAFVIGAFAGTCLGLGARYLFKSSSTYQAVESQTAVESVETDHSINPALKPCEDAMPTADMAEAGIESIGTTRTPRSGKWPSVRRDWLLEYPCCEACGRESLSNPVHHRYPFHQHPEWELMPYLPDGRRQFVTVCPEHHFQCHDLDGIDGPAKPNWSAANEHCIDDMAKIRNRNHPNAKWILS